MALADLVVIGGGQSPFASAVPGQLSKVNTSAQARAACDAAYRFARDASDEIGAGGEEEWRADSAKKLADAATAVDKIRTAYATDSSAQVSRSQWAVDSAKVQRVYDLVLTSQRNADDAASQSLGERFADGVDDLANAIVEAPGEALDYVAGLGVRAVKGAGGILKSAAGEVRDAAESIIPWKPLLFIVGAVALAVVGIVYMKRSGVSLSVPGVVK
jgi:hypothetical protein